MRYIPATHKQARLWVEAASASLAIDKALACDIYAKLCGFQAWAQVMLAVGNLTPSPYDEDLTEPVVNDRHEFYAGVLVERFSFNSRIVKYLLSALSPSSNRKPKRVSIDASALKVELPGFRAMTPLGKCQTASTDAEIINLVRGFRVIDPANWYVMLTHLGWEIPSDSCAKSYKAGEPSFFVATDCRSQALMPVFILPVCRLPGDESDDLAKEYLKDIGEWMATSPHSSAFVFWGSMLTKKISGLDYTNPGVTYVNGEWKEFLMSMRSSRPNEVLRHAESAADLITPPVEFADKNKELLITFYLMVEGIEDHREAQLCVASTASGWGPLIKGGAA